jgi:hypothetical protein
VVHAPTQGLQALCIPGKPRLRPLRVEPRVQVVRTLGGGLQAALDQGGHALAQALQLAGQIGAIRYK